MRKIYNLLMLILSLSSIAFADSRCSGQQICCSGATTSNTTFLPRSFASNASREILSTKMMYDEHRNIVRDRWYGMFAMPIEYSSTINRSSNSDKLGARPFWSGTNTMTYGTNNGQSDIDAYQFGMGDILSQGTIKFDSKIEQVGTDILFHFMQYMNKPGFFFKIHAPLVVMSVDSRLTEPVEAYSSLEPDTENLSYPGPLARVRTISQAFSGGRYNKDLGIVHAEGNKDTSIGFARLNTEKLSVFKIADASVTLGANLIHSETDVIGLGLKVAAPTGNRPFALQAMEPVVGRGTCWAVGGECFGHIKMHENDNNSVYFRWQGELLHLPHGKTSLRTFDLLQNGPGSKYLLVEYYSASLDSATYRPIGSVTHACNITTYPVKSSFAIEGCFASMIDIKSNNWDFSLGGEIWGRSCERVEIDFYQALVSSVINMNNYAVLGRQISDGDGSIPHRCEPLARINKSEDRVPYSFDEETDKVKDGTKSINRIPESLYDAFDFNSVTARQAITGKVVGNVGYMWKECCYKPRISVYGSLEFASDNNAMSCWSTGLQASLHF